MKHDKTHVEIIQECAELLTRIGKPQFSRRDIIELMRWKYGDINENTVNPMIQGMTDNLQGGAPGAVGGNVLHSVANGVFELH
ncbi:hypothetical protein FACS189461_3300 [Spirochaetia bacterium]|nr:hypothetical protein FACS189461_3300 [Spirochaetia bacterium]